MKNLILLCTMLVLFSACQKEEVEPDTSSSTSTPSEPTAIQLESITLLGFDATDQNGNYWDSDTNTPDPFVKVFKSGALVFVSTSQTNADPNASYQMNTAESGELPVIYPENTTMQIEVREADGGTFTQHMGEVHIEDAYNFFYNGDGATEFTNIEITTSNGSVRLMVSGTIVY